MTGLMRAISTPHWRDFDGTTQSTINPLTVSTQLDVRVSYEVISTTNGKRHVNRLIVEVKNTGSVRLIDTRVDILFPKVFMDIEGYGFEIHKAETKTHKFLQPPDLQGGLFPGESHVDKTIRYSVDDYKYRNDTLMELPVEVVAFADGMAPQRVSKPIKELQNF